jgi:hypothetical protein
MPNGNCSARNLPFLDGFSAKDRQSVEEAICQQDAQRYKARELRIQKANEAVEDTRCRLHDLLGADKLAELRKEIKRERLAFRDLWQPPDGLNHDFTRQHKASKWKIDKLIRNIGANPEQLEKIGKEFRQRLEAILSAVDGKVVPGYNLPKHLDTWMNLSPLHKFPLPWGSIPPIEDPSDPHRWFLFRPPFFGFLFSFVPVASNNFLVDRLLFLEPSVGLVGNESTMDCNDAGNFDYASATAEAQIAFGFEAPATGLVEVLVDAQSTIDTHYLEIEDEFGFSSAWCNQNNYLMMNVLHPNVPEPSLSLMSNLFEETDGDDLYANRENLTRGQHYFAHLFSSGPVPAGQSVVVTVGTRTFDIANANDMELHSRTNFQWFINSVEVRIAP